jgi:DNA-binding Lrp family transcriptional regulator
VRGSLMVVTAYILVQTEVGKAARVAEEIVAIEGVLQAEDVTGPYGVIVRAQARNIDELGKLVVARVQAVDGITGPSPAQSCTCRKGVGGHTGGQTGRHPRVSSG